MLVMHATGSLGRRCFFCLNSRDGVRTMCTVNQARKAKRPSAKQRAIFGESHEKGELFIVAALCVEVLELFLSCWCRQVQTQNARGAHTLPRGIIPRHFNAVYFGRPFISLPWG